MRERIIHFIRRLPPASFGVILSAAYLIFCLLSLPDFGITWDEPDHFVRGDFYLRKLFHHSTGQINSKEVAANLEYYGPFFDILSSLSNRLLTVDWRLIPSDCARHLPLVIAASVTVLFTYLFTLRAYSAGSAFLATLFLISFPRFIGHSFNNPKDIPIAMITIICFYLLYLRITTDRMRYSLLLAIVGGIGFATRIQYVIILIIIIIYTIIIWIILKIWKKTEKIRPTKFWDIGLALFMSIPLGIAVWPYFWSESFKKLISLFNFYYLHQQQTPLEILYAGSYYVPGVNLPWHYAPVILLITTPILTLAAFSAGMGVMFVKTSQQLLSERRGENEMKYFILLFLWIGLGLVPFVVPGQRVYGGIRHFLFIVPAICMSAGVGSEAVFSRLQRTIRRSWAYLLIGSLFALQFFGVYSYHPFYTVYYNQLVGGPRGVSGRFQLENWGNAYKKACLWLNRRAPVGATILALVAPQIPRYYLRHDIRVLGPEYSPISPTEYDYSMYIIRTDVPLRVKMFQPVFSLSVKGQPLVKIHRWGEATQLKY